MSTDSRRWGLADATVALVLTIGLTDLVAAYPRQSANFPPVGYLAVWIPLLGTVFVASRWRGTGSFVTDFGLRFRPIDLLWGLGIGLLARVAASVIEIGVYGRVAAPALILHDGWWVFITLVAPLVIVPVVEELFFRGLLLRALERSAGPYAAVAVSSLTFAALHLLAATSGAQMIVVGLSTLIFGVAAGVLAIVTRRIGGTILAHAVFNAVVAVPYLF
jgi:membrane protease YdiL (CAAX protease family)